MRPIVTLFVFLIASLSGCGSPDEIAPSRLGVLMYQDASKQLAFNPHDTPAGEYGSAELTHDGAMVISLSYIKGWAYRGDKPPTSGDEISQGVNGTYAYCLSGLNGSLDGNPMLRRNLAPYVNRFMTSMLHSDSPSTSRANISEVNSFLSAVAGRTNGAVEGDWMGSPTTYYLYGHWLWKVDANDNAMTICAYPLVGG